MQHLVQGQRPSEQHSSAADEHAKNLLQLLSFLSSSMPSAHTAKVKRGVLRMPLRLLSGLRRNRLESSRRPAPACPRAQIGCVALALDGAELWASTGGQGGLQERCCGASTSDAAEHTDLALQLRVRPSVCRTSPVTAGAQAAAAGMTHPQPSAACATLSDW